MNIITQSIQFKADQKLIGFVQRKVDKLDQFFDQIVSGECYLRLENVDDESNKIVELKLNIPGSQLFAKAQAKTFEEATDISTESLRRQINKHKTKIRQKLGRRKSILLDVAEQPD